MSLMEKRPRGINSEGKGEGGETASVIATVIEPETGLEVETTGLRKTQNGWTPQSLKRTPKPFTLKKSFSAGRKALQRTREPRSHRQRSRNRYRVPINQ